MDECAMQNNESHGWLSTGCSFEIFGAYNIAGQDFAKLFCFLCSVIELEMGDRFFH